MAFPLSQSLASSATGLLGGIRLTHGLNWAHKLATVRGLSHSYHTLQPLSLIRNLRKIVAEFLRKCMNECPKIYEGIPEASYSEERPFDSFGKNNLKGYSLCRLTTANDIGLEVSTARHTLLRA